MTVNINEALDRVKNSIYGKDIRQAIIDSVNQVYTDSAVAGNGNMEVTKARGYYATLDERLKALDIKSYVDTKVAGLVGGTPIPVSLAANMTDHTKAYVYTGTESGYTAGHWYYWNGTAYADGGIYQATAIGDKGIKSIQTTFQQIDLSSVVWETGYYIAYGSGAKVAYGNVLNASGFIPVVGGLRYIVKTATAADLSGMAWYDVNQKYIGGMQTGANQNVLTETEVLLPSTAAYVRLSCYGNSQTANVIMAIKSNSIDVANALTQPNAGRLTAVEKQNATIFGTLFKSYFLSAGDITDVPLLFAGAQTFQNTVNGTMTMDTTNNKFDITSVTSKGGGGLGFKFKLPKLTPDVVKTLSTISFELDVDMVTPISLSASIDLYAIKKDGYNTNTPPVSVPLVLAPAATAHYSKTLTLNYDNMVAALLSKDNITIDQIDHFDLYVHYLDIFSNNTITFKNMYFKMVNNTETRITALEADSGKYDAIMSQMYDNWTMSEDDIWTGLQPFSAPTKGDVVIDAPNKYFTIDNTTSLSSGSAGVSLTVPDLYNVLVANGEVSFDLTGHSVHNGGLLYQLYLCDKNGGNFSNPIYSPSIIDTGLGVDFELKQTLTMDAVQKHFAANNYDFTKFGGLRFYIRANTISADFNCKVTNLKFNSQIITKTLKEEVETVSALVSGDNNTVLTPNEIPLTKIKRDGGLYGILQNVSFIGDSLSSGEHEYSNADGTTAYKDMYNNSYGQFAARITGTKAVNWSVGGLTAAAWLTKYQDTAFLPENLTPAYVIYLGTNDMSSVKNPYGMGNVTTDVNKADMTKNAQTFAGRYATIIQKIKAAQPKARIFLVTLPNGASGTYDQVPNPIIRAIADLWKGEFVYLLDLQKYAPNITADFRMGGHLTSMGYMVFAWHVMTYIDYVIRQNPVDFKEVAFIGTTMHNNSVNTIIK